MVSVWEYFFFHVIICSSQNNVILRGGKLPWKLMELLQWSFNSIHFSLFLHLQFITDIISRHFSRKVILIQMHSWNPECIHLIEFGMNVMGGKSLSLNFTHHWWSGAHGGCVYDSFAECPWQLQLQSSSGLQVYECVHEKVNDWQRARKTPL